MRLIDADKLKVLVAVENDGTITMGKLVTELFDDMETVEAIPIQWIERWLNGSKEGGLSTDVCTMLHDWEVFHNFREVVEGRKCG